VTTPTYVPVHRPAVRAAVPPPPSDGLSLRLSRIMEAALAPSTPIHQTMVRAMLDYHYRQIIDVGIEQTGRKPTHVAATLTPDDPCRTVYVDPAPLTGTPLALLAVSPHREFVQASPTDLPSILTGHGARLLDPTAPTAVLLFGVLEHYDQAEVLALLRAVRAALPSRSAVGFTHAGLKLTEAVPEWDQPDVPKIHLRGFHYIRAMFEQSGFAVASPGVVPARSWQPEPPHHVEPSDDATMHAGLAYVPASASA
jgi:S-adenosyl methyltransferase